MTWFAILLVVFFGFSIISHARQAGGWRKEYTQTEHAVEAVIETVLAAGILAWLL